MTNVVNTTGREVKGQDHVWWDERTAAYIITRSTTAHADYSHATWIGTLNSGMFTAIWQALDATNTRVR